VATTDPTYVWTGEMRPIKLRHGPCEPVLHVVAQRIMDGELGAFRASRTPIGMPLGRQRTVVEITAAGRGISPQFPRDGRRRAMQALGDGAYATAAGAQQRDLLSLEERQIPARQRGLTDRRHAPTVPEPAGCNRW
jgi:hypothetical protein